MNLQKHKNNQPKPKSHEYYHSLLTRAKYRHDMTAFHYLILIYQKRIYYLIRKYIHNHEDAEDLTQETFIRSIKYIKNLRDVKRFSSWLSSIAVNAALGFREKHCRQKYFSIDNSPVTFSERLTESEGKDNPLSILHEKEFKDRFDSALMKLPENHRTAVTLFHCQDMSQKEISEMMNWPVGTVATYTFRGVKSLRKELKEYCLQGME